MNQRSEKSLSDPFEYKSTFPAYLQVKKKIVYLKEEINISR